MLEHVVASEPYFGERSNLLLCRVYRVQLGDYSTGDCLGLGLDTLRTRPAPSQQRHHFSRPLISSMIVAICFSLARILSANSAGGRWTKSSLRLGFLISRLTLTTSPPPLVRITSARCTFQARSFSTRCGASHQSRIGWNSSNCIGRVLV